MEAIDRAIDCVRDAGIAASLSDDQVKKLELVVEELFANSATHTVRKAREAAGASCEDTKLSVWIVAIRTPTGLDIHYDDDGPAFDPTAVDLSTAKAAVSNGQVGGLGRVLIRSLPTEVHYRREDGRNRLVFRFNR
jgi:anti-sigma regulatory factor (Ser/Thr protein kinase)